jgi:hypothetical protein
MNKKNFGLVMVLTVIFFCSSVYGAEISGVFFPEYYVVSRYQNDTGENDIEGRHGFRFRRINFSYKTQLGQGWAAELRLEMNSPAFPKDTNANLTAYVKNAYVEKKLWNGVNLMMGIISPPSFDKIEKFWEYRYIEKTAPDFFKIASSRDFGIALDGTAKKGLVYTLMLGNYSSTKGEDNQGKAFYGRIGWQFKHLYLEANGHAAGHGGRDIIFLTCFAGFKAGWVRIGAGYHYYNSGSENAADDYSNRIISAFAVVKLQKNLNFFVRYDHSIDENKIDTNAYIPIPGNTIPRFLAAGFDYQINQWIRLSPNVKYVFYQDEVSGGDLYFNLCGRIAFKTKTGSSK